MNSRELLKAIGEIDDRFIDEAAESYSAAKPAARRVRRRGWAAAAACLIVACGVGITVIPGTFRAANKASSNDMPYSMNSSGSYGGRGSADGSSAPAMEDRPATVMNEADQSFQIVIDSVNAETVMGNAKSAGTGILKQEGTVKRDAAKALWHLTVIGR